MGREFNYTLTNAKIIGAKPRDKAYPLADGGGLFVEVLPSGSKVWRYSYRAGGKRTKVTIGPYPAIGIAAARDAHADYRRQLLAGADPALQKQRAKAEAVAKAARDDTFRAFAQVWVKDTLFYRSEAYRKQTIGMLDRHAYPIIGNLSLGSILPADVLAVVEAARDTPTTAVRLREIVEHVFNHAIRKLLVTSNPAVAVKGVVKRPEVEHYRPLQPTEIGPFLRAVEVCGAHISTKLAVKLLVLTVVRKANIAMARKEHFDLDAGEWSIPGRGEGGDGLMKMKRSHRVHLSRQALALVQQAWALSGESPWLFPSIFKGGQPMGECTINHLFKRLYALGVADDFKPHGLRATASTILNESALFRSDVIERILAHDKGDVRSIYNVAEYAAERREALQWYADHLDERMREGVIVAPGEALPKAERRLA